MKQNVAQVQQCSVIVDWMNLNIAAVNTEHVVYLNMSEIFQSSGVGFPRAAEGKLLRIIGT